MISEQRTEGDVDWGTWLSEKRGFPYGEKGLCKGPEVCLLYSRNSKKASVAKTEWMSTGVEFKFAITQWDGAGCNLGIWQPNWSL